MYEDYMSKSHEASSLVHTHPHGTRVLSTQPSVFQVRETCGVDGGGFGDGGSALKKWTFIHVAGLPQDSNNYSQSLWPPAFVCLFGFLFLFVFFSVGDEELTKKYLVARFTDGYTLTFITLCLHVVFCIVKYCICILYMLCICSK